MSVDMDRQLQEYCRLMDEAQGSLSFDDVLARTGDMPDVPSQRITPLVSSKRRWGVAAAAAGLALLLVVVFLFRPPSAAPPEPADGAETSYEAVFLRLDVDDNDPEVIVVGVNADAVERQIARLPDAWVDYRVAPLAEYLAPMGAVSRGGLLAIPSRHEDGSMYWEIYDLDHSKAAPIVTEIRQQVEQLQSSPYFQLEMRPSVFWGPDERVAIPWYVPLPADLDYYLTFVDGRTGAVATVDIPADKGLLPIWTADGSGVILRSGPDDRGPWDIRDPDPRWVLRPDGSVTEETAPVAESGCNTRYQSGAEIEVLEDLVGNEVVHGGLVQRNPDGNVENLPSPDGVLFACLAPDETSIVFTTDIGGGGLIVSGSGDWIEIDGSFAGWMEVDP